MSIYYNLDFTGEQLNTLFENALSREQIEEIIETTKKGDSAYEIAVKNGFEGSELDWLNSLIGGSEEHVKEVITEHLEKYPLEAPVLSVNNKTGNVNIVASDIEDVYSKEETYSKEEVLETYFDYLSTNINWDEQLNNFTSHPFEENWYKICDISNFSSSIEFNLYFKNFIMKDSAGIIIANTDNPTDYTSVEDSEGNTCYRFTCEIGEREEYIGDIKIYIYCYSDYSREELYNTIYISNETSLSNCLFSLEFKDNIIVKTPPIIKKDFLPLDDIVNSNTITNALGDIPIGQNKYFELKQLTNSNILLWDGKPLNNYYPIDECHFVSDKILSATSGDDIIGSSFIDNEGNVYNLIDEVYLVQENDGFYYGWISYYNSEKTTPSYSFYILKEPYGENRPAGIYLYSYIDGYISSMVFKNDYIFSNNLYLLKEKYLNSTYEGLDARDKTVKNVADPIENADAVNKQWVNNNYLSRQGGTITNNSLRLTTSLQFDRSNNTLGYSQIYKANETEDNVLRISDTSAEGKVTTLQIGGNGHHLILAASKDDGSNGFNYWNLYHEGKKPTASEIGAAPRGFGLGETTCKPISDCNEAKLTGFFQMSGPTTANCPSEFHYGKLLVLCRPSEKLTIEQIAIANRQLAIRYSSDNGETWTAWEYINPPLVFSGSKLPSAGTEYQTTERWNGAPVFTRIVGLKLVVNASTTNVGESSVDIGKNLVIRSIDGYLQKGNFTRPLSTFNQIHNVEYDKSDGTLSIETKAGAPADTANWTAYLTIKYTK